MPHIPKAVREDETSHRLNNVLKRIHQGKVRDTYALPSGFLLVRATNRISIYDFVLNDVIPEKGSILTAMTVFWITQVLGTVANHLVAYGSGIDQYLPEPLCQDSDLHRCCIVVQKCDMVPVEFIIRGFITGSAWKQYSEDSHHVCGKKLPDGLTNGAQLRIPIFTPTTKAEEGHDEPISADEVTEKYGKVPMRMCHSIFEMATHYLKSHERNILLADTKFEIGKNENGEYTLADEILTPDSSRFWLKTDWKREQRKGKVPQGYDKQLVRDWGSTIETPFLKSGKEITGIGSLDPQNADHLRFVETLKLPAELKASTRDLYLNIFHKINDESLADFQSTIMEIAVAQ